MRHSPSPGALSKYRALEEVQRQLNQVVTRPGPENSRFHGLDARMRVYRCLLSGCFFERVIGLLLGAPLLMIALVSRGLNNEHILNSQADIGVL